MFVRPHLRFVITTDGRIRLVGQSALQRRDTEPEPMTLARLPRGRFAVTDAVLEVLDLRARQGRFQLTGADVDLVRKGDDVTMTAHVDLPEHLGSAIDVEAEAGGELADSDAVSWRVRVEADELDLAEWAAMLPDSFSAPGRDAVRSAFQRAASAAP